MELSDLCNFNSKLYSFDDRTGLVVDVLEDRVVPATILTDGNGKVSKGTYAHTNAADHVA